MEPKKRSQAALEAERRYKASVIRVHLAFHKEDDIDLYCWLRSQVEKESEIPQLIKKILDREFEKQAVSSD